MYLHRSGPVGIVRVCIDLLVCTLTPGRITHSVTLLHAVHLYTYLEGVDLDTCRKKISEAVTGRLSHSLHHSKLCCLF